MILHTKSGSPVTAGVGPSCHANARAETTPTDSANLPDGQAFAASGAFYSPITAVVDTSPAVIEAQHAYDAVKTAYDRATTLQQTQKAHEIWPALRTARSRLMAARLDAEGGRG